MSETRFDFEDEVIRLRGELSTLRASLTEREATIADHERWKREAMESMRSWDAVIKFLSGEGFDVKDWGGTWQEACLRRLKLVAERDRQLVEMREALEYAHNKSYILYHTPKAVSKQCRVDIEKQFKALESALASTSSAAERVERRIGAKVLREAANDREIPQLGYGHTTVVKEWLNARADALDRPDGKEEGNG